MEISQTGNNETDFLKAGLDEYIADVQKRKRSNNRTRMSVDDHKQAIDNYSDRELDFRFSVIDRRLLVCPAFRALSNAARSILMIMWSQTYFEDHSRDRKLAKRRMKESDDRFTPSRPKPFVCPYNRLRAYTGLSRHSTIKNGINELIILGFIVMMDAATNNTPALYEHSMEYLSLTEKQANLRIASR